MMFALKPTHIIGVRYCLTVLAVCCVWLSAQAYKPDNHSRLTLLAMDMLDEWNGAPYLTEKERQHIVKGNVNEDKLYQLQRIWNWHFYNPIKPDNQRSNAKSSNRRLKTLDRRFQGNLKRLRKRAYFNIGQLIHHAQDLTNPAHVVPVYHGPGQEDAFDAQPIHEGVTPSLADIKALYEVTDIADIANRYLPTQVQMDSISIATLTAVRASFTAERQHNGQTTTETITWEAFYRSNDTGWMGNYGYLGDNGKGNIDNFGREHIARKDGSDWYIDRYVYDDFSRQQITEAVWQTMVMIVYTKSTWETTEQ